MLSRINVTGRAIAMAFACKEQAPTSGAAPTGSGTPSIATSSTAGEATVTTLELASGATLRLPDGAERGDVKFRAIPGVKRAHMFSLPVGALSLHESVVEKTSCADWLRFQQERATAPENPFGAARSVESPIIDGRPALYVELPPQTLLKGEPDEFTSFASVLSICQDADRLNLGFHNKHERNPSARGILERVAKSYRPAP